MRSILTSVVRRELAVVGVCALGFVAACTRPPAPPVEGPQAAKPAERFLPRALEAVPEGQPVVAVLRAEGLRGLRGQLTELAGVEPPVQALHPWVGLVTLEGRANAYAFPLDLEGLRPGEPVVLSLAYGSDDEAASLLSRGADPGIWARLTLPVEDEAKARAALERWMGGMRLQPLAQPADRSVWAGPGQLVKVSREPSVGLAVDWMVQHTDAPEGVAPPALGWLERAGVGRVGVSRAASPAWRRLLEGSGAAEVYVDMARLPDALLRVDLQDLGRISASAPSHERGALWSRAWSLLLRDVRAMGPLDRQSEAVTLSWEGEPAPTVGLTRGLTPRAQAAQRAGREGAGPVYGPALADPIAWLQVRQDARGWLEALGERAWLQGEPEPTEAAFASLWESRNARLYHLLQGPLTAAMDAGGVSAQWLPQSGTLVVQDVDFSPQGGLVVSAGLVAQYPAGGLPAPLRRKVDELVADLKTSDPTGSVQVEVSEGQGGTQLRVGLRQKAEELLRLDAPITDGPEVSLRVRFQRLRKVAAVLWPGLPEGLLKLQGLELAGRSEGGEERVGLRLDLGAQAPLLDLGTAGLGAPGAAPTSDEGRRCLLGWERALAERLELWPDVPRARQAAFLREMDRAGGAELSCAARDPKTAPQAKRLEEAWGAWRFEAKRDLGLPDALADAQAACKQGHAWGCEGAKGLALPFAPSQLQAPRVAWPQDAFPEAGAGSLYATQGGAYFSGRSEPLASLAELTAPDAQGRLPWVAQRLPKPEHPINRALHVFADQGLPVEALWALLRSAEEQGWRPRLMLEDLGGGPRAVDVVFRPTEPLWAFQGGEHVPPPHAAWVSWGPGGVTLRAEGKALGAWPLAQGGAGRLGLAKAAHGLHGRLGRAPLYHIYIEGSPSWGEVAAWMPGLLATDKAPSAWGQHAERVSGLRGWGEARRPTLVLQAQAPKGLPPRAVASPDPAPLEAAVTDEVLGRASGALEGCFQAHPTPSPVRLRLLVVVPPDGAPKHAQATGGRALEDGALRGCVEELARAWRFPPNQTDTYIERALVFFQEGGAP